MKNMFKKVVSTFVVLAVMAGFLCVNVSADVNYVVGGLDVDDSGNIMIEGKGPYQVAVSYAIDEDDFTEGDQLTLLVYDVDYYKLLASTGAFAGGALSGDGEFDLGTYVDVEDGGVTKVITPIVYIDQIEATLTGKIGFNWPTGAVGSNVATGAPAKFVVVLGGSKLDTPMVRILGAKTPLDALTWTSASPGTGVGEVDLVWTDSNALATAAYTVKWVLEKDFDSGEPLESPWNELTESGSGPKLKGAAGATGVTVEGLTEGAEYRFMVVVSDTESSFAAASSAPSAAVTVPWDEKPIPNDNSNTIYTATGYDEEITIRWNFPGATAIVVERSATGDFTGEEVLINLGTFKASGEYDDPATGLDDTITYSYRVTVTGGRYNGGTATVTAKLDHNGTKPTLPTIYWVEEASNTGPTGIGTTGRVWYEKPATGWLDLDVYAVTCDIPGAKVYYSPTRSANAQNGIGPKGASVAKKDICIFAVRLPKGESGLAEVSDANFKIEAISATVLKNEVINYGNVRQTSGNVVNTDAAIVAIKAGGVNPTLQWNNPLAAAVRGAVATVINTDSALVAIKAGLQSTVLPIEYIH